MKSIRWSLALTQSRFEWLKVPIERKKSNPTNYVIANNVDGIYFILFGMLDNKYFIMNQEQTRAKIFCGLTENVWWKQRVFGNYTAMTPIKTASSNDKNGNKCCLLFFYYCPHPLVLFMLEQRIWIESRMSNEPVILTKAFNQHESNDGKPDETLKNY